MTILAKYTQLRESYHKMAAIGRDPFSVQFDGILSPTEGMLNGRRTILLGTNNYLGLTFDQSCIDKGVEALVEQGTGTTGSRIANGSYTGHGDLEKALADFYGRQHCMVFTTGYQANLGIISTLVGKDDILVIDGDSHASIYDAAKMTTGQVVRFRHNDPDDLYKRLRRLSDHPGNKLVVVEGIYSMLGDTAPLKEFAQVKRESGAFLLVDEAHSMGVLGETGRGLAEEVGVEADVDFIVGTFSKSLGAVGGFCVSDLPDFDILRVACRPYMFTASLPPSVIATSLQALKRLREEPGLRLRLNSNSRRLYEGLRNLGFQVGPVANPIVAVALPTKELAIAFWNGLLEAGLYLNLALPPATPNSLALLRTSVSAAHTPQQIDTAIELFAQVGRRLGVLPGLVQAAE
ncbi:MULTISPECIES: pyridoxal phosphate-dependent aminotransferase family protein [unclassified Azospirillum]|uniref:serine palmitoyltransferase n=1 Tax=unclassified Azospirillum TaxID=2630922 RepID=UPI000B741F5D|nr:MULTISPECIES: pyridoxal phosphate-dependent aminotransferase family protein [unclassified Azospirillum]SNR96591.1 serine palmitoyltransferase [Azospirillum sp. RU38E]SNS13539.1 serine palmitoyltransferase [Azospirillum sp. RU37A]